VNRLLTLVILTSAGALAQTSPLYLDPHQPVEVRVRDLLGRMTLEEKIGQINMPCVYVDELGKEIPAKIDACRRLTEGTREAGIGPSGGFFTLPNTILPEGTRRSGVSERAAEDRHGEDAAENSAA
jgi:hypothetical protein